MNLLDVAHANRDHLLRYAHKILGDQHDADDAVQEALIALWRRQDRYRNVSDPLSLVKGFVRTAARDVRTARIRVGALLGDAAERIEDRRNCFCAASAASVSEVPCMADPGVPEAVEQALADLPEPYRTAVRLRYLDGVVTAEAAARMGLTPLRFDDAAQYGLGMLRRRAAGCLRVLVRSESGSSADQATLELVARAGQLVDRLPAGQRAAIRLRYLDRLTLGETASRLGTSRSAVNTRSRKGVARLRQLAAVAA